MQSFTVTPSQYYGDMNETESELWDSKGDTED